MENKMKRKSLGLKGLVLVGSLLGLGCVTTQRAPRSAESYRREAQAWDTFGYANRSLSTNPNIPWDTRNLLENSANNQDYFRDMYDRKAADSDREEIIGAIRDSAQVKSYGVERGETLGEIVNLDFLSEEAAKRADDYLEENEYSKPENEEEADKFVKKYGYIFIDEVLLDVYGIKLHYNSEMEPISFSRVK